MRSDQKQVSVDKAMKGWFKGRSSCVARIEIVTAYRVQEANPAPAFREPTVSTPPHRVQ